MSNRASCSRGFTLIEILVTLTIVSILATFAFPTYRAHVVRTNRSAAQQLLIDLSNREQQYLMDARAYATLAELGATVPAEVGRRYSMTVVPDNSAAPPSFLLTATPLAGTVQSGDGALTMDSNGVKTPADKWK